jgi:integrase
MDKPRGGRHRRRVVACGSVRSGLAVRYVVFDDLTLTTAVVRGLLGTPSAPDGVDASPRTTHRTNLGHPAEVLAIADNAARLPNAGPAAAVLIVTAAWTGARWGEIVGLQRHNTHLHNPRDNSGGNGYDAGCGRIVIDPHIGAIVESSRGVELGPPKTAESARTITLPPFLTDLLHRHLATHGHRFVFVTPTGQPHRNSNFGRRALRPAVDGTLHRPRRRYDWTRSNPA